MAPLKGLLLTSHSQPDPANLKARALRELAVEDNGIIASKILQVLIMRGCKVVGPAATLAGGLDLVRRRHHFLGAALLDIDLRGEPACPASEALEAHGVPVFFLTGYEHPAIPEIWHSTLRIDKPFESAALLKALAHLFAGMPVQSQIPTTIPARHRN